MVKLNLAVKWPNSSPDPPKEGKPSRPLCLLPRSVPGPHFLVLQVHSGSPLLGVLVCSGYPLLVPRFVGVDYCKKFLEKYFFNLKIIFSEIFHMVLVVNKHVPFIYQQFIQSDRIALTVGSHFSVTLSSDLGISKKKNIFAGLKTDFNKIEF